MAKPRHLHQGAYKRTVSFAGVFALYPSIFVVVVDDDDNDGGGSLGFYPESISPLHDADKGTFPYTSYL